MHNQNYGEWQGHNQNMESGFILRTLLLVETATVDFSPLFVRSYALNAGDRTLSAVENAIKENFNGGKPITQAGCLESFGSLFGLSSVPVGNIILPNGNDTKRFKFIMDLEVHVSHGNTMRYLIQGFTSYASFVSNSYGEYDLPPDLEFHINSITEYRTNLMSDGSVRVTLTNTYNTISALNMFNQDEAQKFVTSRVTDLNQLLMLQDTEQGYENTVSVDVSVVGALTASNPLISLRANSDPLSYLAKLLNSYTSAVVAASISNEHGFDGYGHSLDNMKLDSATLYAIEPIFARNAFIQFLSSIANSYHTQNIIRFDLLRNAFPNSVRSVLKIIGKDNAMKYENEVMSRRSHFFTDQSASTVTASADIITTRLLELNNTIGSYMSQVGLTKASIVIGLVPPTGYVVSPSETVVTIMSAYSILGDQFVPNAATRLQTLISTLGFNKFLHGLELTAVNISFDVDLLSDTLIECMIPELQYHDVIRLPTFCDSLYMPVISTRQDRNVLCNDLRHIHEMLDTTILHGNYV